MQVRTYVCIYRSVDVLADRSIKTKNEAARSGKSRSFFSKFLLASFSFATTASRYSLDILINNEIINYTLLSRITRWDDQ